MTDTNPPQKPLARSFIEGEVALGFWSFVKKGAGALDSFLILRVFSLYQFGAYHLLLSLYAIASDFFHDVFSEVVGNDLARLAGAGEEARAKRLFSEYAVFRLAMAVIPWAAFFFGAPMLAERLGYGGEIGATLQIMAFLFIADALLALSTLILKLRLQFKILAPRATIQKLVQLAILAWFFFFSDLGIREAFWAQLGGAAGAFLMILPAAVRSSGPWRDMAAAEERMFWPAVRSYGKWAVPQSFLADFTGKVRPWLIRLFLNTEAVGIFGVAYTFLSALKDLLPIRTAGSLVPRRIADRAALDRFYRYGTKYYVWMALAISLGSVAAVPAAIILLFPQFRPAIPIFWMLAASIPLFGFVKPMTFLLVAFRRQKFLFLQSVFQNFLSFALLLIFLPTIGVAGLAAAEVLVAAVNAGVRYRYVVNSRISNRLPFRSFLALTREDRANFASFFADLRAALSLRGG